MSGTACVAFMKRAAISASAAPEQTLLTILAIAATDPLSLAPLALDGWWSPLALLLASDGTRCAASK